MINQAMIVQAEQILCSVWPKRMLCNLKKNVNGKEYTLAMVECAVVEC